MTRPNRYPYTRSQWEEETTLVCFGDDTSFKLRVERNRITRKINENLNINVGKMNASKLTTTDIRKDKE